MAILITGGSGIVGRHVVELLTQKTTVVNIDLQPLPASYKNVKNIHTNILDLQAMEEAVAQTGEKIEQIVHLAGASSANSFLQRPYENIQLNLMSTVNVCELARKLEVKRIVYCSSGAVYGDHHGVARENDPIKPAELYGATKASGELITKAFCETFGISYTAIRLFLVIGAGLIPSRGGDPYKSLLGPLEGCMENTMPTGADQRYDLTYVKDAAQGIVCAVEAETLQSSAYNISSGYGYSPNEITEVVAAVVKQPVTTTVGGGRLLKRADALDISLARAELNYEPAYDLQTALAEFHTWLQQQ